MYISIDLQAIEDDSPEKESKALWQLLKTVANYFPPVPPKICIFFTIIKLVEQNVLALKLKIRKNNRPDI